MKTDALIAILLATYNGEHYLDEQLDSLLNQSYQDFKVFIRDDGSTDKTIEIIDGYEKRFPDKISRFKDETLHRGARDSFMALLENIEAPYYMFCDQDDVWLPFKIEKSLEKLQQLEKKIPGKPALIGTDLRVVDEKLNVLSESFWKHYGVDISLREKFAYAPLGGMFAGCTMIFNNAAKQATFPMHPDAYMHDGWLWLTTAAYGKCSHLNEATILYRQHGHNTIGCDMNTTGSSHHGLLKKLASNYYTRKGMLDAVNYGNVYKAIFFKSIYLAKLSFKRYIF